MGATFSRVKVWVKEKLTFAALNAEFDNILANFTPAGMDDASANTTAMRATADPYPAGTASLPTSTEGELQRLRYLIAQLSGESYWYIDPDTSMAAVNSALTSLKDAWITGATPTFVDGTNFTVATDLTTTYTAGRKVKATVTAGTIYGTITASVYSSVTTVTVKWNSGTLDSGLSAVDIGIFSAGSTAVPMMYISTKTGNYTIDISDHGKLIIANSASAIAFAVPADVPAGWNVLIQNIGAGALTLTGTVNGVSNPTLSQYSGRLLFYNGSAFVSFNFNKTHTMTSTDHSAGTWKTFYSDGSGGVIELAMGAAGLPLLAQGASSAPVFGQVSTAGLAADSVTPAKIAWQEGHMIFCDVNSYAIANGPTTFFDTFLYVPANADKVAIRFTYTTSGTSAVFRVTVGSSTGSITRSDENTDTVTVDVSGESGWVLFKFENTSVAVTSISKLAASWAD